MNGVGRVRLDDGCGFVFEATNHVNADVIVTKLDGWFGVDVRTDWQARATDGAFGHELWRDGRKLTLGVTEVMLSDRAAVEDRAREISGVFDSGEVGDGTLAVDGITGVLTAEGVALDGAPRVVHDISRLRVQWELPLMVPDPCLYGPTQSMQVATPLSGMGLEFPLFDDEDTGVTTGFLEWGEAAASTTGPLSLHNHGNATAYPVITVEGAFPSGFRLILAGDGPARWEATYRGEVFPAAPVVVDMAGSIAIGGIDQSWALHDPHWGGVRPGGGVAAAIEAISSGSGTATVTLRSTYL